MKRFYSTLFVTVMTFLAAQGYAATSITVPMELTAPQGKGEAVGTITIQETAYGLLFTPDLKGLQPGIHGFHVHVNPSCADKGMAAGGHFDPAETNHHLGPYNDQGHLGDLPALAVDEKGDVTVPVLAPRLKELSEVRHHSLMIHEGGDNYSDQPIKLGGGMGRMVCGVIP